MKVKFFFRGKKKNGFFVEAGAFDGEYISNSLYFELKHQVFIDILTFIYNGD